jgi:hypothetical protein
MPRQSEDIARGIPHGQYQYVDVVFNSTADGDTMIRHNLQPALPTEIDYQVVGKDRACDVYHSTALDSRQWGANYIVLKCNAASANVTLLLTTRR